jgi:hypothetical protein
LAIDHWFAAANAWSFIHSLKKLLRAAQLKVQGCGMRRVTRQT